MDKFQSYLSLILVAVVAFLLVDRFSSDRERYPLENEVGHIQREFYLHYLATGHYPKDKDFLSQLSKNIIASYPDRFKWDEDSIFLHFTPAVPYRFAPSTIGKPGEVYEHNAMVYWAHGSWVEGAWDHYEASKTEMSDAGITIE